MGERGGDRVSDLPDVRSVNVRDLVKAGLDFADVRATLINQVERPRVNLGSGPPGRAD